MVLPFLDIVFPYVVLGYGVIVTAVLNSPLVVLAEQKLPRQMTEQLFRHRTLALCCVGIGFAWSMQNLWFGA